MFNPGSVQHIHLLASGERVPEAGLNPRRVFFSQPFTLDSYEPLLLYFSQPDTLHLHLDCAHLQRLTRAPGARYTDFTASVGAWRGAFTESSTTTTWMGAYQCQNWISGTAQDGFCAQDRSFSAEGEITDVAATDT